MGAWFLSIAFGHKIGGYLGTLTSSPVGASKGEELTLFAQVYMNSGVYVVLGAAAFLLIVSPIMKKWMHGVH